VDVDVDMEVTDLIADLRIWRDFAD